MRKRKVRPTIGDVAALAGVSTMTVSRAINHGSISPETKVLVESAIRRLGFRPDRVAQRNARRQRAAPSLGAISVDLARVEDEWISDPLLHEIEPFLDS